VNSSSPTKALFSSQILSTNKTLFTAKTIREAIRIFTYERPKFVFVEDSLLRQDPEGAREFLDLLNHSSEVTVTILEETADFDLNFDIKHMGFSVAVKPFSIGQISQICRLR